jgi:hypothetical protein
MGALSIVVGLGCGGRTAPEVDGPGEGATSRGISAASSSASSRSAAGTSNSSQGEGYTTSSVGAATNTAPPPPPPDPRPPQACGTNPDDPCPLPQGICDGDNLLSYHHHDDDSDCVYGYCRWIIEYGPCEFGCADGACKPPSTTLPR